MNASAIRSRIAALEEQPGCLYLHCDMDNYYAKIEELYNPALKTIPFAVCGDPRMRHKLVMSKNSVAKAAGVPTGISFIQAKEICPTLKYIKANPHRYIKHTELIRSVFHKYSDIVIPYSQDEAWINIGVVSYREAEQIADLIRIEILYSLELSVSIGVSFNLLFSKIGSDYRKPNSVTVITHNNYQEMVWPLPANDLLFVGDFRKNVLLQAGINTIGDIANANPMKMAELLNKPGYELWKFANGDDSTFKPTGPIGSIGHAITPPADLCNNVDVSAVIYMLATAVCERLRKHSVRTTCVKISMIDSNFNKTIRQSSFKIASDNVNYVFSKAYDLFTKHYKWHLPIRSIGVCASNLDRMWQLTLIPEEDVKLSIDIDARIKRLVERLGSIAIEKSVAIRDDYDYRIPSEIAL